MDSLDELLADLHSATTSMKREQGAPSSHSSSSSSLPSQVYQVSYNSQREASELNTPPETRFKMSPSHSSAGSGDSPHSRGSSELLSPRQPAVQQYYPGEDAIYEPQNIVYKQTSVNNNGGKASPVSPDVGGSLGRALSSPGGSRGTLGNNLNELDMLLQDLNSTQFMKDMQTTSSRGDNPSIVSPGTKIPPPTLPKPTRTPLSPNQSTGFPQPTNHNAGGSLLTNLNATPLSPTSGSATKELDDLMDSLTKFKMVAPVAPPTEDEPSYAKVVKSPRTPNAMLPGAALLNAASPTVPTPSPPSVTAKSPSELDNMLGSLETDMKGQGVSVDTKGACAACLKPIVGQVITALGQIWHPEHFCCESCKQELGTKSFFERDGRPYCEDCNQELFAPTCQQCSLPIIDKLVTAMDTTWHMECFVCEHCGRMLHDEAFHEREGRPYCRTDFFEMFAPKCGGCGEPIIDDFISTMDNHWHTYCFRCMECGASLPGGSFFDHEGMPYCETHYYAKRGSLCAGCQKPITGRCITAMFKKFHPEHFVCAFCLKQLNKGTFKEQNDKPYCHPCFIKLFG